MLNELSICYPCVYQCCWNGIFKKHYISYTVNVGEDCPVFDGLFEFCQLSTGGSVGKHRFFAKYFVVLLG